MTKYVPNILIVDDTIENLNVLAGMLKTKGYIVRPVPSGKLALLAARNKKPDIILLDINMPIMDGYEVCSILKADPALKDVPVIFISALSDLEDKSKAFEAGGVDYITKPFKLEEVNMRVETHIKLYMLTSHLQSLVNDQVEELTKSHFSIIVALAKLAQSRDDSTGTHLDRIRSYCRILAHKMSTIEKFADFMTPDMIEIISEASALHDIGKVGIPDSVLLKPGKLTAEEFEVIKGHSLIGAQTLNEVAIHDKNNAFIDIGVQIARSHHERWDGTGYPDGLKGEDIPIAARIMAVVDVYDALKSKRCYKNEFPHDECVKIINEGKGSHFDPDMVDIFNSVSAEIYRSWKLMS